VFDDAGSGLLLGYFLRRFRVRRKKCSVATFVHPVFSGFFLFSELSRPFGFRRFVAEIFSVKLSVDLCKLSIRCFFCWRLLELIVFMLHPVGLLKVATFADFLFLPELEIAGRSGRERPREEEIAP